MISYNTSSNWWVTSCRFAPVGMTDNGTPRTSTNRCCFVPFFPPVGRISTNCLLRERSLDYRPVYALPAPGNTLHLIAFCKSSTPQSYKEACLHPVHQMRMSMNRTGAARPFLGQGFPLATSSQHIHDRLKQLAWRYRLSAASGLAFIILVRVALSQRNKQRCSFSKSIGYFP